MRVTVFGSSRLGPDMEEYGCAERLGRLLAERGETVVSGGYGGLMEAVSRGAHEAGGQVIGITMETWNERLTPNPFLTENRPAPTLLVRIEQLLTSDHLMALAGGAGTLAEVALAWNLRQMNPDVAKPLTLIGDRWRAMIDQMRRYLIVTSHDLELLSVADTVEEAVSMLNGLPASTTDASWQG